MAKMTQDPQVNVHLVDKFLDVALDKMQVKNDAAMARATNLSPPVISKLRHAKIGFCATHLVAFHLATDIPVRDIMQAVGMSEDSIAE